MTSEKLDLDPIQALTLEAFSAALAQLDSTSTLSTELREEINQVGEALANHQADAVVRLQTVAKKHQPLYELFEAAYDALDEQYHTQERNKRNPLPIQSQSEGFYPGNGSAPVDKILQILRAKNPVEEAKRQASEYQQMPSQITYTEACSNFDKIYEEAISTRKAIVVTREGSESVSVIPTAELDSLMETVYLFQSPENATRLLAAIERAKARTFKPQTIDDLRQEFGLGEEA
jgi:antitoxin YefM